jgi:myb proto-oncogene protein
MSSSSLLPLAAPTVKAEAYAYDGDFLAPAAALQDPFLATAEGSTSASLSAASSGSNWSTVDNGPAADGGFFADFCTAAGSASDFAAADQFLSGFYYPLDPSLSLV